MGVSAVGVASAMQYGPNTEQVEAYLRQVAGLTADDWTAAAETLKASPSLLEGAKGAIETARSRATKNGLLGQVDAATREAQRSLHAALDASTGLQEALERARNQVTRDNDPARTSTRQEDGMAGLRSAAASGATLLVLRPLLTDDEFLGAWPMPSADPRRLPSHVYVPPMGAVG